MVLPHPLPVCPAFFSADFHPQTHLDEDWLALNRLRIAAVATALRSVDRTPGVPMLLGAAAFAALEQMPTSYTTCLSAG